MDIESLCLPDLTPAEEAALRNYKTARDALGGSLCFDLNRRLEMALWPSDLPPDARLTAQALDAALGRVPPLASPVTVFRGDGHRMRFRDLGNGSEFRNLSYWSTSIHRHVAVNFLKPAHNGGHGVIFRLELPIGLRCYNLETLEGAGGAEAELLLPRGILWRVKADARRAEDIDAFTQKGFTNIVEVTLEARTAPRPIV